MADSLGDEINRRAAEIRAQNHHLEQSWHAEESARQEKIQGLVEQFHRTRLELSDLCLQFYHWAQRYDIEKSDLPHHSFWRRATVDKNTGWIIASKTTGSTGPGAGKTYGQQSKFYLVIADNGSLIIVDGVGRIDVDPFNAYPHPFGMAPTDMENANSLETAIASFSLTLSEVKEMISYYVAHYPDAPWPQ